MPYPSKSEAQMWVDAVSEPYKKEMEILKAENAALRHKLKALVEAIENDGYEGYLFQPVRDAIEAAKED